MAFETLLALQVLNIVTMINKNLHIHEFECVSACVFLSQPLVWRYIFSRFVNDIVIASCVIRNNAHKKYIICELNCGQPVLFVFYGYAGLLCDQ